MQPTRRARWADDRYQYPTVGAEGDVIVPAGYNDPDSPEYGALGFFPDDSPDGAGVYCGPEHLEFVEAVSS